MKDQPASDRPMQTLTPYLSIKGASDAIEFYKKAFGASETMARIIDPQGRVGHAEISIGNATIMLADEHPEIGFLSPPSIGGCSVQFVISVEDVDAVARQAVAAGARVIREVEDRFYGDRSGIFEDPFGYSWCISTHIEDVSEEEVLRRAEKEYSEK